MQFDKNKILFYNFENFIFNICLLSNQILYYRNYIEI